MEIKKKWEEIFRKFMNTKSAAIILIIGVILLTLPIGKTDKAEEKKVTLAEVGGDEYAKRLEKRLSEILSTVSGVADVSVMITLSDSGINTHEKNKSNKNDEETAELSLKSQGSGVDEPVVVKWNYPSVLGVLITARGAEDEQKKAEIMAAAKSLLNVSAHRITVLAK